MKDILKSKVLIAIAVLLVLGCASGWIFHFTTKNNSNMLNQNEVNALQISFMKQYGTQATVTEAIIPKLYEVAWKDNNGSYVSVNIGGVWVLIASNQNSSPPATGGN